MLLRYKHIFLIFTLFIISSLLIHYFVFYQRINFYTPISITIQSTDVLPMSSIAVYGITPFGGKNNFKYNETQNLWQINYTFLKNIYLEIDTSFINHDLKLFIETENYNFIIEGDFFFKNKSDSQTNVVMSAFVLPDYIKDINFVGSYFSILRWKFTHLFFFIIVILALILQLIKKNRFKVLKFYFLKNKKIILLFCFYASIFFITIGEFLRYKMNKLDGLTLLNAMFFIIILFFIIHLLTEGIFTICKPRLQKKQNIRLLYISLFITLSIAEFGLRKIGVYATHSEKNFFKYSSSLLSYPENMHMIVSDKGMVEMYYEEFVHQRYFNADCLPDIDHDTEKDSGIYRIMALGDSFTEGVGASFDSTWVNLLLNKINGTYTDKKIEMFNAGLSGNDPFYAFVIFKDKLLKYKPSLVIVAINTTDISDFFFRGGFERFKKDGSVVYKNPPQWEGIYAYSYIVRLFIHNMLGYDRHFIHKNDLKEETNKAIIALSGAVNNFYILSQKHNFKLLVVIHPQYIEAINGKYLCDDFSLSFKKNKNLDIVDILVCFNKYNINCRKSAQQYYWPFDRHHTPEGYNIFAECVFKHIEKLHILE